MWFETYLPPCILLLLITVHSSQAVSRNAMLNSALHLECRDNQTIMINSVTLGRDRPSCYHMLRGYDSIPVYTCSPDHIDYVRVVEECSGQQSCSNIVLKESTRIPCTSIGLLDSEYMTVNYTCIPAYDVLNICHNTRRTVSPFEGYLSSPDYPSMGSQAMQGVVCNCQISSLSPGVPLQLLLVDVISSTLVEVSEPSGRTRPICDSSRIDRCINDIATFYDSTVNVTFQPDPEYPTKFMLQYRAVRRSSRVRAICSMTSISLVVYNDTLISSPTNMSKPQQIDTLTREVISLEIVVAICAAALILLIFIIVSAIVCRQCYERRREKLSGRGIFRSLAADDNPTYDIVAIDSHHYTTMGGQRKPSKSCSEHIYNEPGDLRLSDNPDGAVSIRRDVSYCSAAVVSGIYESVEYLREDNSKRQSRLSDMKKAGSMPLHPAPPLPRNAAALRQASQNNKQPKAVGKTKPTKSSILSRITRSSTSELLKDIPQDTVVISQPASGTSEICLHRYSGSDTDSFQFNPQLDIDFSDLLLETDKRFVSACTKSSNDAEYMEPVKVFSFDKSDCELVDNELYKADE